MTCRGRQHLCAKLLALAWLVAGSSAALPSHQALGQELNPTSPAAQLRSTTALIPLGTTYSRAQAAAWLDAKRFVVGRWDGTLTLFRTMSTESELGPVLTDALATPSKLGVQMVAPLTAGSFVSSNDAQSLVWWRPVGNGFSATPLPFAPDYGMATSAVQVDQHGAAFLLVGHEQGYVTIWRLGVDPGSSPRSAAAAPRLVRAVSVRSDDPIPWQFQTWHVRGLAAQGSGRAVSVSEDGDICLLEVSSGRILARRRFSATARRGLNDVAVLGDLVAAASCAAGGKDDNLWIYRIVGNSLAPVASRSLRLDQAREQVFAFSVELFAYHGQPHFSASTEEGLIWLGTVKDHKIVILNQAKVAAEGGVVLALGPENHTVLSVGHKVQTFAIGPRPVNQETMQP